MINNNPIIETNNTNNNLFTSVFSLVNKLYTLPDYMLYPNVPEFIWKYLYVSTGKDIQGRYFQYRDEFINLYIVKDMNNESIKDTILLNNQVTVILVIPFNLDHCDQSSINKERIDMIRNIYLYIFDYIIKNNNCHPGSSFYTMCLYAPYILTLLSEVHTGQNIDSLEYFKYNNLKITEELLNKVLEFEVSHLFEYGGLISLL